MLKLVPWIKRALSELRLKSKDEFTRARAVTELGKTGGPQAPERLVGLLRDDKSAIVRGNAALALGRMREPRAVEPLIEAVNRRDWLLQSAAAEALGALGDERAVEPLLRALQDPQANDDLRCAAVDALGALGARRAVEPLIAALEIVPAPRDPDSHLLTGSGSRQAFANAKLRDCALRGLLRMPDVRVVAPVNRIIGASRTHDPLDWEDYGQDFLLAGVQLLERVLTGQAGAVSVGDLRALAEREETVVLSRWEPKWDEEPQWEVRCTGIKKLAREELKRRGLEA
jgi:hypothetical protein